MTDQPGGDNNENQQPGLPEPFNEVEHLQSTIRQGQNSKVLRYFRDLGENPQRTLATPRSSLFTACIHQDNDPIPITILRNQLFYDVMDVSNEDKVFYIGALHDDDEVAAGSPKIGFYFSEDEISVPVGESKVDMDISFRYKKYTQATFIPSVAKELANEIKTQFTSGGKGILHTKGNLRVMVNDPSNGITKRNGILSSTKEEGTALYQKMYACMDKTLDLDLVDVNDPTKQSSRNTGTHSVYGETVQKPAYRPSANVRFRYAYAHIPGRRNKPVYLIDLTYKHPALVYL
jgi:hypothetical protein